MNRLDGPGSTSEKLVYEELRAKGVAPSQIPAPFKNSVVAKSKKGPVGAIVVRKMTGVVDNSASRIARRFEENVGGKDDVAEKLEAIQSSLNAAEKALLAALRTTTKKGLSRLIAEVGAEPIQVLKKYAEGCIELGKIEAAREAHKNLPALVKRLYKSALADYEVCGGCGGTGTLHRKATDHQETIPCIFCDASGWEKPNEKMKEFSTRQLLEITKQVGGNGGVTVNTAVGVKVEGGNGAVSVFEKMMKASDEVLFRRPAQDPLVVDVLPEDSSS